MEELPVTIELTPTQLQLLDADQREVRRVVDPRSNISYVLVSETEYEAVREVLDDERQPEPRQVGGHGQERGEEEEESVGLDISQHGETAYGGV